MLHEVDKVLIKFINSSITFSSLNTVINFTLIEGIHLRIRMRRYTGRYASKRIFQLNEMIKMNVIKIYFIGSGNILTLVNTFRAKELFG